MELTRRYTQGLLDAGGRTTPWQSSEVVQPLAPTMPAMSSPSAVVPDTPPEPSARSTGAPVKSAASGCLSLIVITVCVLLVIGWLSSRQNGTGGNSTEASIPTELVGQWQGSGNQYANDYYQMRIDMTLAPDGGYLTIRDGATRRRGYLRRSRSLDQVSIEHR